MDKCSQQMQILSVMKNEGSITKMRGFELGITKVDTRISELVAQGYPIVKRWDEGINRHGKKIRFMRYSLAGV